ncbi:ABC transporter substrate-binding protein [bacterium]|nr:ABC transporter substrate-binding protein [bacterium]
MKSALVALAATALALGGCGPPRTYDRPERSLDDPPQYGGELNVGTVYVTLSALSWDPADWTWKSNHDTGLVREQLFAADLSQAVSRGGSYPFVADAYIPPEVMRGELAESWEWEDPLTLVVKLRKGVRFQPNEGVVGPREIDAGDIVATYDYINASPKKIGTYFDFMEGVEARDDRTVIYRFKTYNAEWAYRLGYGYYTGAIPKEAIGVDQRDWRNLTGTGPYRLDRYIQGHTQSFRRNDDYWDTEMVAGEPRKLPFTDRVTYRIIKDYSTVITYLRSGKLDIVEQIPWTFVEHLKSVSPELQWSRWLAPQGTYIALRTDRPPLDDARVRRALNIAVNQQEMTELLDGGDSELMAFPQHPAFGANFQPLEEMPESVKELFGYDPEKARALLQEAGLKDGFDITVQVCSCSPQHMDMLPLIESYWSKIGVRMTIEPMEYAAFLSAMTTKTHKAGYLMNTGHVSPTTTLRKNFMTGQTWNPSMYSDADLDRRLDAFLTTRDEEERIREARAMTVEILDQAPYVWLPTQYYYTAWWPWVRNYGGELRAGAVRPGPIYARIWIDHELKRELGFE